MTDHRLSGAVVQHPCDLKSGDKVQGREVIETRRDGWGYTIRFADGSETWLDYADEIEVIRA